MRSASKVKTSHAAKVNNAPSRRLTLPMLRHDDHVGRFDQSVDDQLRASLEGLVLDLCVELLLALEVSMAVEIPHDVLGPQAEDGGVVASPKALEAPVEKGLVHGDHRHRRGKTQNPAHPSPSLPA